MNFNSNKLVISKSRPYPSYWIVRIPSIKHAQVGWRTFDSFDEAVFFVRYVIKELS